MLVSLNWLKDFVKLPAKVKPAEIAARLTQHTVEVEGFSAQAEQFKGVKVGKVLTVDKHPNADRLRVTTVDIKSEVLDIVCGAPNVEPGQMVPVAIVGASLPNGLEIKEAEIRGAMSRGMICAEDELGLGKNHEGILILDPSAKLGQPFAEYIGASDIILEVDNKSLSNRPDLLGHYGLAREVAAIFNLPFKEYSSYLGKDLKYADAKGSRLAVKVEDKAACPRYSAVMIDKIKVGESPRWLKERLTAANQRPINNIVDLTNYVMLDCGQPLHAFDAAKVSSISVRPARSGELIETLDGKECSLSSADLVIADGKQAIAIAGVMGGQNSEVDDSTVTIILESANFSAAAVRRTSQRLGLRSEASTRFEKSLDPNLTTLAIRRFVQLLKETCPEAEIISPLVDVNNIVEQDKVIDLDLKWLDEKIGFPIERGQTLNNLRQLGFKIDDEKADIWRVTVPSWRATKDINRKEDLAEEALRLYGYDNIPSVPLISQLSAPEISRPRIAERQLKTALALKHELSESYNYSFVGDDLLKKVGAEFFAYLRLANPLSGIQNILRQSLVPGLALNVKNNQARGGELGFFEIGNVYFGSAGDLRKDKDGGHLPYQQKNLALALAGDKSPLNKLKGILNNLPRLMGERRLEIEFARTESLPGWAETSSAARILLAGEDLGIVANLTKDASANLNLKKAAAFAEINFSRLADIICAQEQFRFQEAPKYPAVERDLAFVVSEEILYNDLRVEIIAFNSLIRRVELFDVYAGNKLPEGQKSLAFHISYQSDEKTLSAAEVDSLQSDLLKRLDEKFSARLRDF